MKTIYLDYNATTPVADEVRNAICHSLEHHWGNPSSSHPIGQEAKRALEDAREKVAALIRALPGEVVFNSGGTEGNNSVLIGVARELRHKGRHIVTSKIEHPSVMNPLLHLLEEGWDVTFLTPSSDGRVQPEELRRSLRPDTVLVSVMLANNETGAIQPIREMAGIARASGVLFHTDGAQAVGKIEVDVEDLGVDYLTIAGHKLYGPKGIGALYIRSGAPCGKIMFGGGQEAGRRDGTEPVSMAVGLGTACEMAQALLSQEAEKLRYLRDLLYHELCCAGLELELNCSLDEHCLPNTLSVSFSGCDGAQLLDRAKGVLASLGAACHSPDQAAKGGRTVSHVLAAMGVSRERALGTVRLSVGRYSTEEEIREAAAILAKAAKECR